MARHGRQCYSIPTVITAVTIELVLYHCMLPTAVLEQLLCLFCAVMLGAVSPCCCQGTRCHLQHLCVGQRPVMTACRSPNSRSGAPSGAKGCWQTFQYLCCPHIFNKHAHLQAKQVLALRGAKIEELRKLRISDCILCQLKQYQLHRIIK